VTAVTSSYICKQDPLLTDICLLEAQGTYISALLLQGNCTSWNRLMLPPFLVRHELLCKSYCIYTHYRLLTCR